MVDYDFEYDGRENKVVSSILSYDPDIIGLQEVSSQKLFSKEANWFTYLGDENNQTGLVSAGYAVYKGESVIGNHTIGIFGTETNYSPIYYKADKFRVITELSGTYWYTDDGKYGKTTVDGLTADHDKAFTYVVFEDIDTGARFVYINSHMEKRDTGDRLVPIIQKQSEYLDSFVDSLQNKEGYVGLPVIIGGDFNYHFGGIEGFFGNDSIIKNAAKEANKNGGAYVYGCSTVSSDFTTVGDSSSPIDHWYVCGDAYVSGFEVLDNKDGEKYPSDHLPVRLTVTLTFKINV